MFLKENQSYLNVVNDSWRLQPSQNSFYCRVPNLESTESKEILICSALSSEQAPPGAAGDFTDALAEARVSCHGLSKEMWMCAVPESLFVVAW